MRAVQPLKSVATLLVSNVDKKSVEGDAAVRLCNYVDVYYNDRITGSLEFMEATATAAQIALFGLREGDVLFTKDSETADDIAVPAFVPADLPGVVCGYHLAIARPRGGAVDGRYLHWALSSQFAREQFTVAATGVTRFGLRQDEMRSVRIPVPPLAEQRAIADYLDTETARIDALIAKKQRMADSVVERGDLALESAFARRGVRLPSSLEELEAASAVGACRVIRLSQCLDQLTNGYVGPTRDILEENGIRYVQSLHIKGGRIDFDRRPFFVTPEWHAERPRIHLRENDVLIVQTGDIGQVAVVPPGFGEASCHALQIARVRPSVVLGPYLAEYLRSSLGYQSLLSRATGALHPHLEGGIRTVPVVAPSLQVQREVIEEVAAARRHSGEVSARLGCQIDLLRERRQALITAAVTGELEVPGVAA